jgi:mono/diheme cytochrome c family protein
MSTRIAKRCRVLRFASGLLSLLVFVMSEGAVMASQDQVKVGEYVFRSSGGCSCHAPADTREPISPVLRDKPDLSGGRPLNTKFGIFYGTNITPDAETGIGKWTTDEFVRAMTEGRGPSGTHFFPTFPYTSFARMKRADIIALKNYLFSLPPVKKVNRKHDVPFPFSVRQLVWFWKLINFEVEPWLPDPKQSESWNRGSYLVTTVGHCGECHSPRNFSGGIATKRALTGSEEAIDNEFAPNLTPDVETGIGSWTNKDISYYLKTTLDPEGDAAEGLMAELIEQGYSHLTDDDLDAIAIYLKSLWPAVSKSRSSPK